MSWFEDFQAALREGIADADRRTTAEVGAFIEAASASGATTDAERAAAFDKSLASLPPDKRKEVLEQVQNERDQLEQILTASGYKGDVDALTHLELARLAAERGVLDLSGDAPLPTSSALEAAAGASLVGGSWSLDQTTGNITIYRDAKGDVVHEVIPGGDDARPAAIVEAEIVADTEPGAARPTRAQLDQAAKIQEANPGSSLSFGQDGSITVHRRDGTGIVVPNNPLQQGLEDIEASAGDLRSLGTVLDGAARRSIDNLADGIADAFQRAKPSFGGGAASGMGGTGGAVAPGVTTGTTPSSTTTSTGTTPDSGYQPGGSQTGGYDPTLDTGGSATTQTSPSKPGSSSTGSTSGGSTTTGEPAGTGNDFVERHRENDNPASGDADDGYRPSTITPPTDATGKSSDDRDDGKAPQPQPDSDGDGIPDDEDEDTNVLEYTPGPDDEGRKVPTAEELARLMAAALAGDGRDDRPPIKLPEHDPAFAQRMQERKLGMIGNPGDPDLEQGATGGPIPDTVPLPDPDDDTPGHDSDGVDKGEEDRLQGDGGQGPVDPSLLEDAYVEPEPLPPQPTVVAEVDPGLSAPLQVAVAADVNIETPLAVPGYHHALGDPAGTTASAGESGADAGIEDARVIEPITHIAAVDRDVRLGGELSIASGFRPPSKDANDEEADNG